VKRRLRNIPLPTSEALPMAFLFKVSVRFPPADQFN